MAGFEARNFETPDETRSPEKTTVETVTVGGAKVGRATFQPGWRWSECIKPVVGTDDCRAHHLGVLLSVVIHVAHADGSEGDINPGDVYSIEPGHDAWVVGDDVAVGVEFDATTVGTYGKG
jgi:hypothetical protein